MNLECSSWGGKLTAQRSNAARKHSLFSSWVVKNTQLSTFFICSLSQKSLDAQLLLKNQECPLGQHSVSTGAAPEQQRPLG